jgi:hypothetical protein
MTKYEISAAIGMYRSGATFETIAYILNETAIYIEITVNEYLKNKKL